MFSEVEERNELWGAAHMGECRVPTREGRIVADRRAQDTKMTPGDRSSGQNFPQGSLPKTNLNETDYHFLTGHTSK